MKVFISLVLASLCGGSAMAAEVITHKNCQIVTSGDVAFDSNMKAKGFKPATLLVTSLRTGLKTDYPVFTELMADKKIPGLAPLLVESLHIPQFPAIKLYRPNGQPVPAKAEDEGNHMFSTTLSQFEIGNQEPFYFELVLQLREASQDTSYDKQSDRWEYLKYKSVYEKVVFRSTVTNFEKLFFATAQNSKELAEMRRSVKNPQEASDLQALLQGSNVRSALIYQKSGLKTPADLAAVSASLPKCEVAK